MNALLIIFIVFIVLNAVFLEMFGLPFFSRDHAFRKEHPGLYKAWCTQIFVFIGVILLMAVLNTLGWI